MIPGFYPTCVYLAACVVCLLAFSGGCRPAGPPAGAAATRSSETRRLMGVPWTITVYADSLDEAREVIQAAFAEVARLEGILSDYDPTSEVSRLSAAAPTATAVPASADLWPLLVRAVEIRDATGGAFDPTVGPLTTLWRQSRRSELLPRAEKLAAALAAVGPEALVLDRERRAASLTRPGMRLDFGGIGMGYAVDRAMELLRARGIQSVMIDASGDIAVSNPPPGKAGWTIVVAALDAGDMAGGREQLVLANAAVTTSGDAFQSVEIAGTRYSHIVDPRTGVGVAGPSAVTVIAPDCTTADALATAANVLGPGAGLPIFARFPGCSGRFVWQEADARRESRSANWPAQPSQTAD
jgi:thiamine biosynthesis lipoprotein